MIDLKAINPTFDLRNLWTDTTCRLSPHVESDLSNLRRSRLLFGARQTEQCSSSDELGRRKDNRANTSARLLSDHRKNLSTVKKRIGEKPVQPQCKPNPMMIQDLQRGEVSLAPLRPRDYVSGTCMRGMKKNLKNVDVVSGTCKNIKLPCTKARLHVHDVVASEK